MAPSYKAMLIPENDDTLPHQSKVKEFYDKILVKLQTLGRVVAPSQLTPGSSVKKGREKQKDSKSTWQICSDKKVHIRSEASHTSNDLGYMRPGEEFLAEGPFKTMAESETGWLRLVSRKGFVCTTSIKCPDKVVALKIPDVAQAHTSFALSDKDRITHTEPTFVVCSDKKVHVRSDPRHDSKSLGYLRPGDVFAASGPSVSPDGTEWMRLTRHLGFVCTTSSKCRDKVVLTSCEEVVISMQKFGDEVTETAETEQQKLLG
jgi:hypothetical protein